MAAAAQFSGGVQEGDWSMNLKALYIIGVVVFFVSIPVMSSLEKIIFLARGYDKELVFEKKDTYASKEMVEKYYAAFKKESRSIMFWSRLIALLWAAMLAFSIVVIVKRVAIPFKLQYITAAVSG
jgi:hypothetical protein